PCPCLRFCVQNLCHTFDTNTASRLCDFSHAFFQGRLKLKRLSTNVTCQRLFPLCEDQSQCEMWESCARRNRDPSLGLTLHFWGWGQCGSVQAALCAWCRFPPVPL
uniref:Uncharacterized protein n=1 Tax=Scophthalmus maximus TaxID=52904 RepID=A0A8D3CG41_SCOMX